MKTNVAIKELETSGLGEIHGMSVQVTGKMFEDIISNRYSNKPESITREIWSNAWDAHAMSNKLDVPFKVSFPSSLDASFRCRDYGPGMSHEFMTGGYTVAFLSTKEDTNSAVGCKGVGRLSPFSYTDTYSVTTYIRGTARHYSVFLKQDGTPAVAPMGENPTSEPDGTEVSFAIESRDLTSFREAAMRVSLGFDVKPTCNQADFTGWPELQVRTKGNGWMIYARSTSPEFHGAYAKMGCVLYPIKNIFDYGTTEYEMLDKNILIEFAIGDLAVTGAREGLSYGRKEPTTDSIKDALSRIVRELGDSFIKSIADAPNEWLARNLAHTVRYLPRRLASDIAIKAQWGGKPLSSYYIDAPTNQTGYISGYDFRRRKTPQFSLRKHVPCEENTAVVIERTDKPDKDVRGAMRIGEWYRSLAYTDKPDQVLWFKVTSSNLKDTLDWLKDHADHLPVHYVKDFHDPGPSRVTSSGSPRKKTMVKSFLQGESDWEMDDEQWDAGGYYCRTRNNDHVRGRPDTYWRMLVDAGKIKNTDDVAVVPATFWSKFEKADQWVEIHDVAQKFIESVGMHNIRRVANRRYRDDYTKTINTTVDCPVISLYNQYLNSANAIDPTINMSPRVAQAIADKNPGWQHRDRQKKIAMKLRQRVYQKYPLLEYLTGTAPRRSVNEYINLIKENSND